MTRRALVTGCSSGIGNAVTLALIADGWSVVGLSRTPPHLWIKGEFPSGAFHWHHADLATGYGVSHAQWAFEDGLDALVHCAAVQGPIGPLRLNDQGQWLSCIQANLLGAMRALKITLPDLRRSEDGRILLFAGGGAFNPRPNYSAYAASKAGVVSLMETLAAEEEGRIGVNCVSPGWVPTPMTVGEDVPSDQMDRVVACVRHLLSPATKGLTGKTISAEYDDWARIAPENVESLNDSLLGNRHRYLMKIPVREAVAV